MNNKLYVGGLSYSVTDSQLQELFAAHGSVESARVITDKFTSQSRGFGFVEMGSGIEAQAAISGLNGTQYERSEEHTSELQSLTNLVCRLLLEKKKRQ